MQIQTNRNMRNERWGKVHVCIDRFICVCMNTLSYMYSNIAWRGKIQITVEAYTFTYPATLHLCKMSIYIYSGISGQNKIEDRSLPCQFSTPKDLVQEIPFCRMNT